LILAGDFNNWSRRRSEILNRVAGRLRLVPVTLVEDKRSRYLGYPVDFVYYRGVELHHAETLEVSTSDHNPILVKFSVPASSPVGGEDETL
jgi:endonuclease/exonuclease/phosphatase (EEP) superfamily protein YafD